jgi:hypothetical protein
MNVVWKQIYPMVIQKIICVNLRVSADNKNKKKMSNDPETNAFFIIRRLTQIHADTESQIKNGLKGASAAICNAWKIQYDCADVINREGSNSIWGSIKFIEKSDNNVQKLPLVQTASGLIFEN